MKRLIALIVLALVGFYAVWPAWSGYRIAAALQSGDAGLLESKIDFPSIRRGLRPIVEGEVSKEIDKQSGQGLGAVLGGDLKRQLAPKLTDMVLDKVVTGENVIRIAREGGNVGGTVQKILMEQISKSGGIPGMPGLPGLGGGAGGIRLPGGLNIPGMGGGSAQPAPAAPAPAATAPTAAASKPSYGMSNIKSFGWSPLAYTVGIGRDPAASKPEATVKMRFSGFDWKITDIVPQF
jgi:hypothetical protein